MIKFKPIIGLSFILIFLVISLRFVVFISFVKTQKAEFRKQLFHSGAADVRKISMPVGELYLNAPGREWKDKNKEIVLNNVYYEVVYVRKTSSDCEVFIIEDKAENTLFNNYFQLNTEEGRMAQLSALLKFECTEDWWEPASPPQVPDLVFPLLGESKLPTKNFSEIIKPPAPKPDLAV